MATGGFAGYTGIIKFSTSTGSSLATLAEMREFSITVTHGPFDATSHDSSGWREKVKGIREWTGSAEHVYVDDNATQEALFNALSGGTKVDIAAYPVGSSSGSHWTGSGFITNWELSSPNEDIHLTNVDFEGTEAIALTTSTG